MKAFIAATVVALAAVSPANATLQISSLINGTPFFCADGDACDTNSSPGVLSIGTQTFGSVSLLGSLQLQQIGGTNFLNTSSFQITNNGAADASITVAVGGTDFLGPVAQFSASGSGTWQTAAGSEIRLQYYGDAANQQGASDTTDTPGALLADSGVLTAVGTTDSINFNDAGAFVDVDQHSLTLLTTGTLVGGGSLVGRSQTIVTAQAVPEPASLALLGGALLSTAVMLRRRRRRS